jgi:hypothetical protein
VNRLQKFIEIRTFTGEEVRTAYALGAGRLPAPEAGAHWQPVDDFSAADKLLENVSLKGVFQVAITDGCAVLPVAEGK